MDIAATGERTVPGLPLEEYWFARHEVAYRWIAARRRAAGHQRVLDAGAGEGYGTAMLAPAIALEYDPAVCRHLRDSYPGIPVVQANLAGLPVRSSSIDAIACLQVVEHLWDLAGFLRDCRRTLRPGGELIVTTPQRLTFSPGLARGEKPVNPFHVEEFDAQQLQELVREAGFTDITMFGVRPGPRLAERPGLIAEQIEAAVSGTWPAELEQFVAGVRTDDFLVTDTDLDTSLDLVVVAS